MKEVAFSSNPAQFGYDGQPQPPTGWPTKPIETMSKQTIYVPTRKDEKGNSYIPYCRFRHHPGIPKDPVKCEARKCFHYVRLSLRHDFYYQQQEVSPKPNCEGLEGIL